MDLIDKDIKHAQNKIQDIIGVEEDMAGVTTLTAAADKWTPSSLPGCTTMVEFLDPPLKEPLAKGTTSSTASKKGSQSRWAFLQTL